MFDFLDLFGDNATGMTPEGNAFMNAISDNESNGEWNVIYGGQKFDDYSQHPGVFVKINVGPNKGKFSSAAGKFQILKSTYDRVAPLLGITDFSPESQIKIAWYLAQEAYANAYNTGMDGLQKALEKGDVAGALKVMKGVWTSLPGGIEATQTKSGFGDAYDKYLEEANSFVPGMGLPDDPMGGVRPRESSNILLPTELRGLNSDAQKKQDNFIASLTDAMDKALVVPQGLRTVNDTVVGDRKFASAGADLLLAGSQDLGVLAPILLDGLDYKKTADFSIPLKMPTPLDPNSTPAAKAKLASASKVALDFINESTPAPAAKLQTVVASRPMTPIGSMPAAKKSTNASESTPVTKTTDTVNSLDFNDAKLAKMVNDSTAKSGGTIATGGGIAGSAQMPADYKPTINTESKKSSSSSSSASSSTPAVTYPTVTQKFEQPAKAVEIKPTGTANGQQASLSNPIIQPISTAVKAATTTTKTPTSAQLAAMDDVSKVTTTTKTAVDSQKMTDAQANAIAAAIGILPTAPLAATEAVTPKAVPAAATVAGTGKAVAEATAETPKKTATTTTTVAAPAKTALTSGTSLSKVGTVAGDLKTEAKGTAKIKGAVTQTKQPTGLLDVLGDMLFNNGAKTIGLIGDALSGKSVRTDTPTPAFLSDIIGVTKVSGMPIFSTPGDIVNKSNNNIGGVTATGSQGSYGSSPGQSTAGLKPGDREYNADTNTWELKN